MLYLFRFDVFNDYNNLHWKLAQGTIHVDDLIESYFIKYSTEKILPVYLDDTLTENIILKVVKQSAIRTTSGAFCYVI